jgi:lipid-A-disaccharide synthase-like uncharacterized protein
MMGKLGAAATALVFAGCATHMFVTGRFKTREFKIAPYVRRRDHPVIFWTYAGLLAAAAAFLIYIAVFVA